MCGCVVRLSALSLSIALNWDVGIPRRVDKSKLRSFGSLGLRACIELWKEDRYSD